VHDKQFSSKPEPCGIEEFINKIKKEKEVYITVV
jgi:hypothetical protein